MISCDYSHDKNTSQIFEKVLTMPLESVSIILDCKVLINLLSANPRNCLSVFDHFVGLAHKGLSE